MDIVASALCLGCQVWLKWALVATQQIQNTHAMQTHEDIHDTIVAGSSATHIVLAYVVTYMGLACSKKYSDKPDPHQERTRMPVCILSPQWEFPVSSCLAWVSAAHKHTGGPLLQILGIYRDTWHGGMSHGFNPTRKPPQRGCENWKDCGRMIPNLKSSKTKQGFLLHFRALLEFPHKHLILMWWRVCETQRERTVLVCNFPAMKPWTKI